MDIFFYNSPADCNKQPGLGTTGFEERFVEVECSTPQTTQLSQSPRGVLQGQAGDCSSGLLLGKS